MGKELSAVIDLIRGLGKSRTVSERLNFFGRFHEISLSEQRLHRWENWLQMEVLFHLSGQGVTDLWFEDRYAYDQRRSLPENKLEKQGGSVDLAFRRTGTSTHSYVGIELKVNYHPDYSMRRMIQDLDKVSCFKDSEWAYRAVVGIAVFGNGREAGKYADVLRAHGGLVEKLGKLWSVAMVGWEAPTLAEATQGNYRQWVNSLLVDARQMRLKV